MHNYRQFAIILSVLLCIPAFSIPFQGKRKISRVSCCNFINSPGNIIEMRVSLFVQCHTTIIKKRTFRKLVFEAYLNISPQILPITTENLQTFSDYCYVKDLLNWHCSIAIEVVEIKKCLNA
ncbi:CLUMA_CG013390, isoform A [Clunio marinus]|uniref:CLUMA_CG013390, isoform A n=1 Tax=Clunio marinus TaxID=568069 RepID=A0A1J1IIP8_9DIPT|nr:CLUMA_CG013390, isoform A [Clunio marinus]